MEDVFAQLDTQRPDLFGHGGYFGALDRSELRERTAQTLAAAGLDLESLIVASPDVAYYRFENGYYGAVLLGTAQHPACSAASAERPYEMAVMHGTPMAICYANPVARGDVICPLDAAGVRECLDQIAALAPDPDCGHGRDADEDDEEPTAAR